MVLMTAWYATTQCAVTMCLLAHLSISSRSAALTDERITGRHVLGKAAAHHSVDGYWRIVICLVLQVQQPLSQPNLDALSPPGTRYNRFLPEENRKCRLYALALSASMKVCPAVVGVVVACTTPQHLHLKQTAKGEPW